MHTQYKSTSHVAPAGTAITYVCLPLEIYHTMQEDIAEMKRYMFRNPKEAASVKLPEFVTPKQLEKITGYSHSSLSRHIKDAQAAGVQIIGQPGKHRVNLAQFLAYLENLSKSATPQAIITPNHKRK